MKDLEMKKKYQIINLIGSVICGLILTSLFAWLSASDEIKHPSCIAGDINCLNSFGGLFLYFLKQNLLLCLGSFLAAYLIQLIVSRRYFSKYNGIFIGLSGIIFFSLFAFLVNGSGTGDFRVRDIFVMTFIGLFFSLVMFSTLLSFFAYEKIKPKRAYR